MHHLRGNAIPADHVQNLLTNSYEILCRCSLKQNFDIMGIEMWAKLAQNCKNLIYFVKICSLGTNLLERFFFTKLGRNLSSAPSHQISSSWFWKCRPKSTKIVKIWNFWYKSAHRGRSSSDFLNKIRHGRESPRSAPSGQISPLWL